MRQFICTLFFISIFYVGRAQLSCSAESASGSGYAVLEEAGFGIETPDCRHGDFGAHITQVYDSLLNRYVFIFHSHIIKDDDRCINDDRVRIEIKGGSSSPGELRHDVNSTSYYRWKFRLDKDFTGSSSFCHIFQNKAYGGDDSGMPLITITPRASTLQIIHNGGSTGNSLGVVEEVPLVPFKGMWIEGYIKQVHGEKGSVEISLKDVETGTILLSYSNDNLDMWRTGAEFNRPKWGIYRSRVSGINDEMVRFADFCVTESSKDLCPAENLIGISGWFSVRPELQQLNDSAFTIYFTKPLYSDQIVEENFIVGGTSGLESNPFTVKSHDSSSVLITFSERRVLPTYSTIVIRAENLSSLEGHELQGNVTGTFIEPDRRPVVSGIELTVDNVDGFVVASSSKSGLVYVIKSGEYPASKASLDSLVEVNLGRSEEALHPNVSIPLYTNGLPAGFYNYYAVDEDERLSLPGQEWVIVEDAGAGVSVENESKANPLWAYRINNQVIVDPGTDELYSLEIFSIGGKLLYMNNQLLGIQHIDMPGRVGILVIRKRSRSGNSNFKIN